MAVLLSPIGNGFQFLTTTGLPLNGGLLYTYQAGSSTPLATYSDNAGNVANANPIVLGVDGRPASEIWLTNGFSYKFVLCDSSNNVIQTYDNLYGILQTAPTVSATVPSGLIAIWSGSLGSIPSGWVLCNGSNGTPDLRNSFILGAGSTYAVGTVGGSADAIVVSHTHTATSTVTDPGHTHTSNAGVHGDLGTEYGPFSSYAGYGRIAPSAATINSATTGITVATSNASTGVSGTNANLPPYYALAFIMKT
jgi:hypothetical protein